MLDFSNWGSMILALPAWQSVQVLVMSRASSACGCSSQPSLWHLVQARRWWSGARTRPVLQQAAEFLEVEAVLHGPSAFRAWQAKHCPWRTVALA